MNPPNFADDWAALGQEPACPHCGGVGFLPGSIGGGYEIPCGCPCGDKVVYHHSDGHLPGAWMKRALKENPGKPWREVFQIAVALERDHRFAATERDHRFAATERDLRFVATTRASQEFLAMARVVKEYAARVGEDTLGAFMHTGASQLIADDRLIELVKRIDDTDTAV